MPDDQPRQRRGAARPSAVVSAVGRIADECGERLGRPLEVLDLGGGTGGVAVPLAEAGHRVTVVDPSPDALASLARRAREAGIEGRVTGVQGDGDSLYGILAGRHVDLVCCHGTLEFVDDPAATLRAIAQALGQDGVLSLLVSGRLAVVFAKAIAGEFTQARAALVDPSGRWGSTDPLPRRFDVEQLETLLADAGFTDVVVRGTNILGHLVPASLIDSEADRAALAELDDLLVSGPGREFLRTLGNALHVVARRA
ncbi:MAG: class I SAM-dependent methyltransferase [Dermatophilaceae bacterium]|nr:class I SAM-dependent methyltransferase [Dermatophilaceae bacterium]NUQ32983.1 class I SAM-dependent methyltransferase [Dermatophilaceae bacterium]NUR81974.1 class I SAM-dependent methyltransferase [Dermatophilaceae bacterium]